MKFILVTMQVLILLIVLPVLARDVDVGLPIVRKCGFAVLNKKPANAGFLFN